MPPQLLLHVSQSPLPLQYPLHLLPRLLQLPLHHMTLTHAHVASKGLLAESTVYPSLRHKQMLQLGRRLPRRRFWPIPKNRARVKMLGVACSISQMIGYQWWQKAAFAFSLKQQLLDCDVRLLLNRLKAMLHAPTTLALLYFMMPQRSGDAATREGTSPSTCPLCSVHPAHYRIKP